MRGKYLFSQLRAKLIQWKEHMQKCVFADSIDITPISTGAFSVDFRWRDGSFFTLPLTPEYVFESSSPTNSSEVRLRWDACRFRKDIIRQALMFKGL